MEEIKIRESLGVLESAHKEPDTKEPAPPWYQQLSFDEVKAIIRENIASASRSFIAVGYYLKYIRDHELYKESGLGSIWEFAQEEYGISKSTASRYMTMNDRFSEGGNSPVVAKEYRGYGKSQLQEMLYLNDEQMEQVTPETQVKQIRELRQPAREIPYFELPGQLSIDDFPDVMPEPTTCPEQPETSFGSTVLSVEDFGADEELESIAISQQEDAATITNNEPEPKEAIIPEPPADEIAVDTSTCPPNNGSCRRQEWGTSPEEQKAGHKECVKCWEDWKKTQRVLNAAKAQREEKLHPEPDEEPTVPEEMRMLEVEDPLPEPEAVQSKEESLTDLQIAKKELERAQNLLSKCLKDFPDEKNVHIRGMKIKVCALASYVCDLDNIENPPPTPVQPELPLLKNNDQRVAFVDAYENWPLWIETKETGERYYRYDLEDGTSLVVKVYHAKLFDYKTAGLIYEERFTEGYGRHEYYLLEPGKYFRNCETNRSELVEKLKEIQKAKKG